MDEYVPAETAPADPAAAGRLVIGDKGELGANPHPVYMQGKPIVIHGVQDGDLTLLGALSLAGATCLTLLGYALGAYQSYSIALQNPKDLSVQTISDYRLYVWGSKAGLIVFGVGALIFTLSTWRKLRQIKRHGELYVWSDGKLIPAENPDSRPGLVRKLCVKIYKQLDETVS